MKLVYLEQPWHISCYSISESETVAVIFVSGQPFEQCHFDNEEWPEVVSHYETQADSVENPELVTMYKMLAFVVKEAFTD